MNPPANRLDPPLVQPNEETVTIKNSVGLQYRSECSALTCLAVGNLKYLTRTLDWISNYLRNEDWNAIFFSERIVNLDCNLFRRDFANACSLQISCNS